MTREEIVSLGFSEDEADLATCPIRRVPRDKLNDLLALNEKIREAKAALVAKQYSPIPRSAFACTISDHADADGGNIWHPAMNAHIGSKAQFRAETRARGYEEVGNEYESTARSDDYHVSIHEDDKRSIEVAVDNAMTFVDKNASALVSGLRE